jgi:hypothetical protein
MDHDDLSFGCKLAAAVLAGLEYNFDCVQPLAPALHTKHTQPKPQYQLLIKQYLYKKAF